MKTERTEQLPVYPPSDNYMSSYIILSPKFNWGIRLYILEYLTIPELYVFGQSNKASFIIYLRERCARSSSVISPAKYLGKYQRQETVLLTSYPRCGNSYFRQILEEETGILTGSDSRSNRTLSASLLKCGYRGEGIVDDSVWIVKSHYPERMGYLKFKAHRILLLVRNVFDAVESYFHMAFTNTHHRRLSDHVMLDTDLLSNFIEDPLPTARHFRRCRVYGIDLLSRRLWYGQNSINIGWILLLRGIFPCWLFVMKMSAVRRRWR